MKTLKIVLLMMALLFAGMLVGCQQEQYSRDPNTTKQKRVTWQQTPAGINVPKIIYVNAD
jgi:hypothetical protein